MLQLFTLDDLNQSAVIDDISSLNNVRRLRIVFLVVIIQKLQKFELITFMLIDDIFETAFLYPFN